MSTGSVSYRSGGTGYGVLRQVVLCIIKSEFRSPFMMVKAAATTTKSYYNTSYNRAAPSVGRLLHATPEVADGKKIPRHCA